MFYQLLIKLQACVFILAALFIQTLLEPLTRWFTPDIFFLAVVYQFLIYRNIGFVLLLIIALLYDVYTDSVFGGEVLALALVLYFLELAKFYQVRFSLFSSTVLIVLFYIFYQIIIHIISFGVEILTTTSIMFILTRVLATALAWFVLWKWQASHTT